MTRYGRLLYPAQLRKLYSAARFVYLYIPAAACLKVVSAVRLLRILLRLLNRILEMPGITAVVLKCRVEVFKRILERKLIRFGEPYRIRSFLQLRQLSVPVI